MGRRLSLDTLATAPNGAIVPLAVPLDIPAIGDATWGPGAHQIFTDIANDVPVDASMIATATCAD